MKKTNVNRKFIKGKKKTLKKQRYDLDGGYKRKIEFNQTDNNFKIDDNCKDKYNPETRKVELKSQEEKKLKKKVTKK